MPTPTGSAVIALNAIFAAWEQTRAEYALAGEVVLMRREAYNALHDAINAAFDKLPEICESP